MARILVVDDDETICSAFEQFLAEEGHTPAIASTGEDAIQQAAAEPPDLVIMDLRMPGMDGLLALEKLRELYPSLYVVLMTAFGTSQTSIEAMRLGAYDYLEKPLDLDVVKAVIEKALKAKEVSRHVGTGPSDDARYPLVNLVGKNPKMQEAYKLIGLLATNDVPALLIGERGTGKHLVARTIHFNSGRKEAPFVSIDCRVLKGDLLARELFGRSMGEETYPGKLDAVEGGTLFLDNIDALDPALQTRLIRLLTEKSFERVAGVARLAADVRVLAGTEKDLAEKVRSGVFVEDLYDRLALVSIRLPPLRERPEDIHALVSHFVQRSSAELGKTIKGVDPRALEQLEAHAWPGNVGELEGAIRRAAILARGEVITLDDLGDSLEKPPPSWEQTESVLEQAVKIALRQRLTDSSAKASESPFHDIVEIVEEILVSEALTLTSGNQVKATELLGLNRTTLRKKLRRYLLKS